MGDGAVAGMVDSHGSNANESCTGGFLRGLGSISTQTFDYVGRGLIVGKLNG